MNKKGTNYKRYAQYHLPTFNTTVKSTSLPLAYKPEDKRKPNTPSISPKHNKVCDYDGCDIQGGENVKRMVCGHTYHTECYTKCPVCVPYITNTAKPLSEAFNQTLLHKTQSSSTNSVNQETNQEDEYIAHNNHQRDPQFYHSTEFQQLITTTLNSFEVTQPGDLPQANSQLHQSVSSSSTAQPQAQNNLRIPIALQRRNGFCFYYFPNYFSQSTINNRQGSNACTFISLLLSNSFFTNRKNHIFDINASLPADWAGQMSIQIVEGNRIHDSVTGERAINFSISEALPHVSSQLGSISVEESLDLEFCLENLMFHIHQ